LWLGLGFTLASITIFGTIAVRHWDFFHLHDHDPPQSGAYIGDGRYGEEMPTWMAAGVAGLFGLIGVGSLITAIPGIRLSQTAGAVIWSVIMVCIGAFFDAVCIYGAFWGKQRFVDLPFLPAGLNRILSGVVWGTLIVSISIFIVAGMAKMGIVLWGQLRPKAGTDRNGDVASF
jgi:hypothetical protein